MIITLMGAPSSGKSYLARKIAAHYGLQHYSLGDLRRKAAEEKGMSLAEFNVLGETEDTDTAFDDYQKKLGREEGNFVIDGRLSALFIPQAIKIYVDAEEPVRARRMLSEDPEHKRVGEAPRTEEEAVALMRTRVTSDKKRFLHHYSFDPYTTNNYDIVLDTTNLNKEESVAKLIKLINEKRCRSPT